MHNYYQLTICLLIHFHKIFLPIGLELEWHPGKGFVVQSVHGFEGLPVDNRNAAMQVKVGDILKSFNGSDVTGDPDSARATMQQKTIGGSLIELERPTKRGKKKHHTGKHGGGKTKKNDSHGIGDLLGSMKKKREKAEQKAAEEARKRREELEFLSRPTFFFHGSK